MKKLYTFLGLLIVFTACSDFDEQEFTVLLPKAGADQVLFTEDTGTTIQLDGSGSSDINQLGFDYRWKVISAPEGFPVTINNANAAKPTFEVQNEVSGRYVLSMEILRGDQVAKDIVNIDINPAFAQVLFVNAIDSEETASLNVPAVNITGNPVATQETGQTYVNIDTNVSTEADGTTTIEVNYGGAILTENVTLEALKVYTLYLVGDKDNPELFLVEKINNQNSIGVGLVGLEYINLSQTENALLFIDVTSVGLATAPIPFDAVLSTLGIPGSTGALSFKENNELFFPSQRILPLPIWATVNGNQISNDSVISLEVGVDANFGTFILFPDKDAINGHTLKFINNSDLLPQ